MKTEITNEITTIGETENGLSRDELVSYAELSGLAGGIFMPHAVANRALKAEIPTVNYTGQPAANMGIRVNVADGNSASSSYNIDPDTREWIDGRPRSNSYVHGKMRRVHSDMCGNVGCYVHPVSMVGGLCRESVSLDDFLNCRQYWSVTTIPHLWRTIGLPFAQVTESADGNHTIGFPTRSGYVKASQRRGAGPSGGYKPIMYARHREAQIDGERVQWWEPVIATLLNDINFGPMWVWIPEADSEYYAATFAAPVFGGWE